MSFHTRKRLGGSQVLVGSKKWEILTQQVKLFNQLSKSENM